MTTAATPHQSAFVVWWHELDRWIVPTSVILRGRLPSGWTTSKVGEVVCLANERIEVNADHEYKMAGVRWYGEGVFHRETVGGGKMSARYVAPLKPGALIYNRLFAWKSSFAVVPPALADCYVSNEFPQFITDSSKVLAEYLYLWCLTDQIMRAVNLASTGSAAVSRNRFREEFFLGFEIPLPPLSVQNAIVAVWEKAQKEIADTRRFISEIETKIEADFLAGLGLPNHRHTTVPKVLAAWWKDLERWSVMFNQLATISVNITNGDYPVAKLGDVSVVSYGVQKCPANRPGQHPRPYLRVANVQRGELDLREVKWINIPEADMPSFRLEVGDLLVCEGNSADLVGRPAIWRGEIPDCVHQNHVLKVRINRVIAVPEYLLEYMQTGPARNHFRSRAKFTTNLASINSTDLRGLPILLPPLDVQHRLVAKSSAQRLKIVELKDDIKRKSLQAKADVEAMVLGNKSPIGV